MIKSVSSSESSSESESDDAETVIRTRAKAAPVNQPADSRPIPPLPVRTSADSVVLRSTRPPLEDGNYSPDERPSSFEEYSNSDDNDQA